VQRKAASHEFSVSRFRDFMSEVFVNHTCTLVEHIGNLVGGSAEGVATAVDMNKLFSKYTLQSIGEIGCAPMHHTCRSHGPPVLDLHVSHTLHT